MKINCDLTWLTTINCDLTGLTTINCDLTWLTKINCDLTWLTTINCDLTGLTMINCDLTWLMMINCDLNWFKKIDGDLAWLMILIFNIKFNIIFNGLTVSCIIAQINAILKTSFNKTNILSNGSVVLCSFCSGAVQILTSLFKLVWDWVTPHLVFSVFCALSKTRL